MLRLRSIRRPRWAILLLAVGLLLALTVPAMAATPATSYTYNSDDPTAIGDDLMVENDNNMWVLDADTGHAYHENLKNGRTNDISIGSFLKVWYDAKGTTPTTAKLWATYGYMGCGHTTWQTGSEFTTRFVSYDDGLVISFEADSVGETGEVAYTIQGQNGENDWAGGHTQARAFAMKTLSGVTYEGDPVVEVPWYELSWDTALNKSIGTISEISGKTRILLGGTSGAVGYNKTNCGAGTLVWPTTPIRWWVDTLDIVD